MNTNLDVMDVLVIAGIIVAIIIVAAIYIPRGHQDTFDEPMLPEVPEETPAPAVPVEAPVMPEPVETPAAVPQEAPVVETRAEVPAEPATVLVHTPIGDLYAEKVSPVEVTAPVTPPTPKKRRPRAKKTV